MLNEQRLPTIARLWPEFAERSDKEGWQATRLIGALLEHELAEQAKRRIERHRAESHLGPTKTRFSVSTLPVSPAARRAGRYGLRETGPSGTLATSAATHALWVIPTRCAEFAKAIRWTCRKAVINLPDKDQNENT